MSARRHVLTVCLLVSTLDGGLRSQAVEQRLRHEVLFDQALELAAVTNPSRDEPAALALLDTFVDAPLDAGVFAGRVVKSALLFRQRREAAASELMRKTLNELNAAQSPQREAPLSEVDADVAAIRTLLFRPLGDLSVYRDERGSAFTRFLATPPEFAVLSAGVTVTVVGAGTRVRTIRHALPDFPKAVYLDTDDLTRLNRIVAALGGIMDKWRVLVPFWNRFFPAAETWFYSLGPTSPAVNRIEFLDEARTRATAGVTIGNWGGVLVLEKVDGKWVAVRRTGS
jgi:hypothetical protein